MNKCLKIARYAEWWETKLLQAAQVSIMGRYLKVVVILKNSQFFAFGSNVINLTMITYAVGIAY